MNKHKYYLYLPGLLLLLAWSCDKKSTSSLGGILTVDARNKDPLSRPAMCRSVLICNENDCLRITEYDYGEQFPKVYIMGKDTLYETHQDMKNHAGDIWLTSEDDPKIQIHLHCREVISRISRFWSNNNLDIHAHVPAAWISRLLAYKSSQKPIQGLCTALGDPEDTDTLTALQVWQVQLDEDTGKELVVFIQHAETPSHTIIMKRKAGDWYTIAKIDIPAHNDKAQPPQIDEIHQLVIVRIQGWGSGFFTNDVDLYKLQKGKVYEAFSLYEALYQEWSKHGGLSQTLTTDYKLLSDSLLQVKYTYTLFQSDADPKKDALYILQDKDTTVIYLLDKASCTFRLPPDHHSPIGDNIPVAADNLYEEFQERIRYLSAHGSKQQRAALKYLKNE